MFDDRGVGGPKVTNNGVLGQLQRDYRKVFDIPLIKGRSHLSSDLRAEIVDGHGVGNLDTSRAVLSEGHVWEL